MKIKILFPIFIVSFIIIIFLLCNSLIYKKPPLLFENNFVTKVIYINLDRRQDRKKNVMRQLHKSGITETNVKIERVPGVDWTSIDFNNLSEKLFSKEAIDSAINNKGIYTTMTKGGIGCALAHRNACLSVLNSNDEYVLILEDDIKLPDNFIEKLNECVKKFPKFDILYLGYHSKESKKKINDHCYVPSSIYGMFGYILNKKAAKEVLNLFPLTLQIDSEIPKSFNNLKVFALAEDKRLVYSDQSSETSEFGTDIQFLDTPSYNNTKSFFSILTPFVFL